MNASTQVPATCDECGTVFASGIALGVGASATIVNSKAGPCPRCGAMGSIPNGLYEFVGEARRVMANWSPERRQRLADEISAAKHTPQPREAVTEAVTREPELAAVAQRLLIPRDAGQFWALVAALAAIITVLEKG